MARRLLFLSQLLPCVQLTRLPKMRCRLAELGAGILDAAEPENRGGLDGEPTGPRRLAIEWLGELEKTHLEIDIGESDAQLESTCSRESPWVGLGSVGVETTLREQASPRQVER